MNALNAILALEASYRAWLDLVAEDEAGHRPDDALVLGALAWVRACQEAVGPLGADLCWRRVSRSAPVTSYAAPGAHPS